jgi:hypothetical protein
MPDIEVVMVGAKMRLDPPTMADSHSPLYNASQASCKPTIEDEQAVRYVML